MRLLSLIVVAAMTALGAAACGSDGGGDGTGRTPPPAPSAPSATATSGPGAVRDVATGLAVPWAIAFLPGGDALVTERDSTRLLRVSPQGRVQEVGRVPGVQPGGEGGLMGVAVSPDFAKDRFVYLYFTASGDNRVVRFRYTEGQGVGTLDEVVTGIPKGANHNGGRIKFGPDGMLYIATGETYRTELSQDRDSLGGKILRVTPTGAPAAGNPFGSRVWTLGHRNVQGLAWDGDGRMYATEFGQNTYDEINLIEKGRNYGWPDVEGVGDDDQYTNPILTWSTSEASPSGLAFAGGSLWAAALQGERLWQVPIGGDGDAAKPVPHLEGDHGRLRAVARTPDGTSLWVATSNEDGRGDPAPKDDRIIAVPLN